MNTIHCNFDGGDCINFNREYQGECKVQDAYLVGNGECNEHLNIAECRYDGGDCCEKNEALKDKTTKEFRTTLGEVCNPAFNTDRCLEDYGRCSEFNKEFKECNHEEIATTLLNDEEYENPGDPAFIYSKSEGCQEEPDPFFPNVTVCVHQAKYPNCTSNIDKRGHTCAFKSPGGNCERDPFPPGGLERMSTWVWTTPLFLVLLFVLFYYVLCFQGRNETVDELVDHDSDSDDIAFSGTE